EVIRKKRKRLVTDSRKPEEPGDLARLNDFALFALFKLFAPDDQWADVSGRYLKGGLGYGEVKGALADLIIARFEGPRARRAELVAHPERVEAVRRAGAERARKVARVVLDRAREACGVG